MALLRCILVELLCATIAATLVGTSSSGVVVREPSAATASSSDVSGELRQIVAAGQLSDLRWPDFSDYRVHLKNFYEPSGYSFAWIRDSQATPQAQVVIDTLQQADSKGLNAEDYDSSRWKARLGQLNDPASAAHFDVALTVCVMRYISDLHIGRVNPQHFNFALSTAGKKYDLAQFVRSRLVSGNETKAALESIEPPFAGYKRTQAALQHYVNLSQEDDGEQLPSLAKSINPGDEYSGVPRLTRLLRLLGDLPVSANAPPGNIYESPLVEAVKHFQERHGLIPNGRLDAQTLKQLNTPLSSRVEQLRLTLERWRWLPLEFAQPPVVVNIPEFRLRTYDVNGQIILNMRVIVGKAYRHQTPVFEKEMQYIVFRPYWNVPPSIQRSEIVPAIQRDRNYVAKNNYEVITPAGTVVTSGAISDEVLEQLRAGKLAVRQKPGPTNALGLVKLIFPNQYNVYLHSTPSQQLFSQSRRDFSHGCIRVEKPDELVSWALRDKPEWTLARVRAAMQSGKDNVQVNLAKPIPVLILYGTAVVDVNGVVQFFDDIYGHDDALKKVLAKGYPYPG
ncbi:MAG TPA: L,D-transpeptidase family protein [Terriglobales bacterium]